MPIRPEFKHLYPIDWPQISHWVRFVRAKCRAWVRRLISSFSRSSMFVDFICL